MKSDFVKSIFEGDRFHEHTLPLEFAKDLAAYGELVLELAKRLYFKEHPTRKRVPSGFDQDFNLHLDRIEDGNTLPILALVWSGLLLPSQNSTYFEKARDLIVDCIQSETEGRSLPSDIPIELFEYFDVFGRSLLPGEKISFHTPTQKIATLTPENRRSLALKAKEFYLDSFIINGSVTELDLDKQTFRLKVDNSEAITVPFKEWSWKEVKNALGMQLWRATVKGVASYDRHNELKKIETVDSIEVLPNHLVVSQIEELEKLEDGWCHQLSKAPNRALLDWATGQLESSYPAELGVPMIGASAEGNLFIEWAGMKTRVSAELFYPSFRSEAQAVNIANHEMENAEFDLSLEDQWPSLYEFVRSHLNEG